MHLQSWTVNGDSFQEGNKLLSWKTFLLPVLDASLSGNSSAIWQLLVYLADSAKCSEGEMSIGQQMVHFYIFGKKRRPVSMGKDFDSRWVKA